jgi:hypothetical protein
MKLLNRINRNIVNIPGWSTRRKIVVIESDDWGSIRMSSKQNRDDLIKSGFNFENNHYNMFDSLESNDDLSSLFEVLTKYKDASLGTPIFTAVSIIANPDFEKIKSDNFENYHYEPFTETLKRYSEHEKVKNFYKQGISERLFYPVFHGREHLNVNRWMNALKSTNESIKIAFENNVTGVSHGIKNEYLGDFQAAFDIDSIDELPYLENVLIDGLNLFEKTWNFKARYFVAPNGPFNNSLEKTLAQLNVDYIMGERLQLEPIGNGKYKKHLRYLGMKNNLNQHYITRNAFFEPSCFSTSFSQQPVEKCLKSIERAFRWGKPAVISSHRVNYIGFIDENNRSRSLKLLDTLLNSIIKKWPDVEFMTSVELGDLIAGKK